MFYSGEFNKIHTDHNVFLNCNKKFDWKFSKDWKFSWRQKIWPSKIVNSHKKKKKTVTQSQLIHFVCLEVKKYSSIQGYICTRVYGRRYWLKTSVMRNNYWLSYCEQYLRFGHFINWWSMTFIIWNSKYPLFRQELTKRYFI